MTCKSEQSVRRDCKLHTDDAGDKSNLQEKTDVLEWFLTDIDVRRGWQFCWGGYDYELDNVYVRLVALVWNYNITIGCHIGSWHDMGLLLASDGAGEQTWWRHWASCLQIDIFL